MNHTGRPSLSLFRPETYFTQLERLRAKAKRQSRGQRERRGNASLSGTQSHRQELSRRIADEIRQGTYRLGPLDRTLLHLEGKQRIIHRPGFIDALVLGAMSQRLTALLETVLDDGVHAYRPGRGPERTLALLCRYLDEHRSTHADPRQRGLFVLQRDLSAYGESIPTEPTSELWPLLRNLLRALPDPREARILETLLETACRPELRVSGAEPTVMQHGLPTGSPIQQPLANLYLIPLDRAVRELRPAFYARFGDDLLVLDPDPERATAIATTLNEVVQSLGLRWNQTKTRDLYFTRPGRPFHGPSGAGFSPASHIEYLGARVSFQGRLGLKRKRLRQLLLRARWRIENTLSVAPKEEALESTARALQAALHKPTSLADPLTVALRSWVDDRDQLREIDRHLAQLCAELLSGVRGVRAFRHVRAQALRDAGFCSVLELRRRAEGTK